MPALAGADARARRPASTRSSTPTLHRNRVGWDELDVPGARARRWPSGVWERLQPLAEPDGDAAQTRAALDAARGAYDALYAEAEAIAQSSVIAGQRRGASRRSAPAAPRRRRCASASPAASRAATASACGARSAALRARS